jgi:DNA-3-methyladenine glycosylase
MDPRKVLPPEFLQRPVLDVAVDLLGRDLCIQDGDNVLRVRLVDVEAYHQDERGCHAYGGRRSARHASMFLCGGHSYVYFVYGMHWVLNFVTGAEHEAAAVMVRGALPLQGLATIAERRQLAQRRHAPKDPAQWLQGPAKLCQGLGIDRRHDGLWLGRTSGLWLEAGEPTHPSAVLRGPRIGIDYAGADATLPWRLRVAK